MLLTIFASAELAVEHSEHLRGTDTCFETQVTGRKERACQNVLVVSLSRMKQLLDANNTVITALSGVAVAVFTATLWWTTRNLLNAGDRNAEQQYRLMERQIGIAEKQITLALRQHTAEFRPKLIVRQCLLMPESLFDEYVVNFEIANVGGSFASICGASFKLDMFDKNVWPIAIDPGGLNMITNTQIEAGSSLFWRTNDRLKKEDVDWFRMTPQGAQGKKIVFHGTISYKDGNGTIRKSAFWREQDWTVFSLRPVKDSEAEYFD